jgi:hypothetical protein
MNCHNKQKILYRTRSLKISSTFLNAKFYGQYNDAMQTLYVLQNNLFIFDARTEQFKQEIQKLFLRLN